MIARIDQLNIVVTDLAHAIAYIRLLGFDEGLGAELAPAFLQRLTGIAGVY